MIIVGIIILIPIISVNFSFLNERNTLNAKKNVGIPTQAKMYIATVLDLSSSCVLKSTRDITIEKIMKMIFR